MLNKGKMHKNQDFKDKNILKKTNKNNSLKKKYLNAFLFLPSLWFICSEPAIFHPRTNKLKTKNSILSIVAIF